MTRKIE